LTGSELKRRTASIDFKKPILLLNDITNCKQLL
jgi:hypothetical protein